MQSSKRLSAGSLKVLLLLLALTLASCGGAAATPTAAPTGAAWRW